MEFMLPSKGFYQYLQLRHALQAQQQMHSLAVSSSSLLMEVLWADARKGLISKVYSKLLSSVQDHTSLKCKTWWVEDIGDIDWDQWDMALESIPAVSVSAYHKLSQLFMLHRAYRMPIQIVGVGGTPPYAQNVRCTRGILYTCFGDSQISTNIGRRYSTVSPD